MTDRELIEAAAKAAGVYLAPEWRGHHKHFPDWNPLEDDGDALRLAVALRISLDMLTHIVDATTGAVMCHEPWGDDDNAATRRAIVRAAAALAGTAPGGA